MIPCEILFKKMAHSANFQIEKPKLLIGIIFDKKSPYCQDNLIRIGIPQICRVIPLEYFKKTMDYFQGYTLKINSNKAPPTKKFYQQPFML
jgi:hypothetical protein